jgi:hypothetical protein
MRFVQPAEWSKGKTEGKRNKRYVRDKIGEIIYMEVRKQISK